MKGAIIMKFNEHFKQHYEEWLKGCSAKSLVMYEQNLSRLIDSDLFSDCILSDEIIMLYELIRNECVARVHKIAETDLMHM